ncbi:MAG TPA: type II toxin-antitoxin system VapC family toxin [Anaerolineales bacterium]|nr:type II toxin-antitoxin system VapC family toxin [Anaerolineales bacterium]
MNYLLDTDTCVFWLRGQAPIRERVQAVGVEAIRVSVVTLAELRYGAEWSERVAVNHQAIDDFMSGIVLVGFSPEAARVFGQVKAQLRRQGAMLEDSDLMIAATALAHDYTLVTNNVTHFNRIANVKLENWTK